MTTYNSSNFWVDKDNPFDDLPKKRKPSIVQLSEMTDIISTEFDGQVVTRSIPSKDYNKVKSAETHKERKERVEKPYIITHGKPAKRANRAKSSGYYTMIDDTSSVLGDISKESNVHTVEAGKERGERGKYPYKHD